MCVSEDWFLNPMEGPDKNLFLKIPNYKVGLIKIPRIFRRYVMLINNLLKALDEGLDMASILHIFTLGIPRR